MCKVKAPPPQVIETEKPTFVRNPFLDELDGDVASADALRRGRTSLVIPKGTGIGFSGRGGSGSGSATGIPNGNGRVGPRSGGPGPGGRSGGGSTLGPGGRRPKNVDPRRGGGNTHRDD